MSSFQQLLRNVHDRRMRKDEDEDKDENGYPKTG